MIVGLRIIVSAIVLPVVAGAAPALMPVQGYLTDSGGTPIDGPVTMRLAIHDTESGGEPLFAEEQTVTPVDGRFTAYMGAVATLDLELFASHHDLWLAVAVDQDSWMPRARLGTTPYAAWAAHCGTVPPHEHAPADTALSHEHTVHDVTGAARAEQSCKVGQMVTGIDVYGFIECASPKSFSGMEFAISGLKCPDGEVMVGVQFDGSPACAALPDSGGPAAPTYDGTNFALSGQTCAPGQAMVGISPSGTLICAPINAGGGGGGLEGSGTTNRLAKFSSSSSVSASIVTESSNRIGINDTSPSRTLDVKGDLQVTGDFYWGGNKFSTSSCVVMGGTSCSSACSAHGMSCYKAFKVDGTGTSDSCSQSGFKFCCCRN